MQRATLLAMLLAMLLAIWSCRPWSTEMLADRTAVVTGAGGALGSAIAKRFVQEGVRAIALVDLDESAVERLAAELVDDIAGRQVTVLPVRLDVCEHDAVIDAYRSIADSFGGLDIAVCNAGVVAPSARLHNVLPQDFQRVLNINLAGVFNCMKAAILQMRQTGGGAIVNTASVAGFTTWTHSAPYGVSKAGVIQLTKLAAAEYASERIRVNCVSPGTFVTGFHDDLSETALDDIRGRHPLGRFGDPNEIAGAYAYLAGDNAAWITGTNLVIDGGMSVG
jgi:NAD(P)-dependent dehydrogenase (short-subunit alcohol dehydrogenase family)